MFLNVVFCFCDFWHFLLVWHLFLCISWKTIHCGCFEAPGVLKTAPACIFHHILCGWTTKTYRWFLEKYWWFLHTYLFSGKISMVPAKNRGFLEKDRWFQENIDDFWEKFRWFLEATGSHGNPRNLRDTSIYSSYSSKGRTPIAKAVWGIYGGASLVNHIYICFIPQTVLALRGSYFAWSKVNCLAGFAYVAARRRPPPSCLPFKSSFWIFVVVSLLKVVFEKIVVSLLK